MAETHHEILRSSYAQDGSKILLMFDAVNNQYRIATRWTWVVGFESIWDACDAFEALELLDDGAQGVGRLLKREIKRVPRHNFVPRCSMGRINYLINSVERRLQGLRPQRCGRKGGVERWIPVAR